MTREQAVKRIRKGEVTRETIEGLKMEVAIDYVLSRPLHIRRRMLEAMLDRNDHTRKRKAA